MVGVVGGDADLGRVMDLVVWTLPDLALVADGVVENGEERFLFVGAVPPVTFSSAFIPNLTFLAQVVVFLRLVGAVVTQLSQVGWIHFIASGQACHAAHVLGTGGRRIHARYDGRPSGSANGSVGDCPGVNHSFGRQNI